MNARILLLSVILSLLLSGVQNKPLENVQDEPEHKLSKRFINPSITSGDFSRNVYSKLRMKRDSEDDCEKLRLCKLHAASNRDFIAAFELYFVNKENARLWDHQAHSSSDCEQRFSCYR